MSKIRTSNNKISKIKEISKLILEQDNVLVICHSNADADAFGSVLSLSHMLNSLNKKNAIYIESGKPHNFPFFEAKVYRDLNNLPFTPRLLVFLDCAELERAGEKITKYLQSQKHLVSICIDHHLGNTNFATHNWVDPKMAATAQMCFNLAKELKIELCPPLGEYLYLGINGDTGSFSHSNTNSKILRAVAKLCDLGLDIGKMRNLIDKQDSLERFHLWAICLQRTACQNHIVYSYITKKEMQKLGQTSEDLEGFVEHIRHLKDSKIAIMIREENDHLCRISLRSHGDIDVRQIAMLYQGGGHKNASGLSIKAKYEVTIKKLLKSCEDYLSTLN